MGKVKLPRHPSQQLNIELKPIYLEREENDERIQKLTFKILRALENSKKRRPRGKSEFDFADTFEKKFPI